MTKQIPTPHLDAAIKDVRDAVNRIKPAALADLRGLIHDAAIVNGKAAAAALETPKGSPERQQVRAVNEAVKAAEAAAAHPENYTNGQIDEIAAMLKGLVMQLGNAPKQSKPVDPKAIAKVVAEELKPLLAPTAPAPAPRPEPEPIDANAIAAKVLEGITPLLATGEDGRPAKAASESSVTALSERVNGVEATANAAATQDALNALAQTVATNDTNAQQAYSGLQEEVRLVRNNVGTQPNWLLGGICGLVAFIVLGLILWFTAGWMLALVISVLTAAAVTGLVAFIFERDIRPNLNN